MRKQGAFFKSREVAMSPDALNSLFSLFIGFALAGALASGYQAMAERPAGFGLLGEGVAPTLTGNRSGALAGRATQVGHSK